MAIISELDNDTEEVKLNFMVRSGSLFSFSVRRRNGFQCVPLFTNAQCLAWMAP